MGFVESPVADLLEVCDDSECKHPEEAETFDRVVDPERVVFRPTLRVWFEYPKLFVVVRFQPGIARLVV